MTDTETFDKTTSPVELRLSNNSDPSPRRLHGGVPVAVSRTLGEKAGDCVSQDTGVVPPEMRAAQLAEAARRGQVSQSPNETVKEALESD